MNIKRNVKPKNQKKLFEDDNPEKSVSEVLSSKDLFDPKLNPTLRLDAHFAIELAKKLEKQNKKDIVGDKN